MKVIRVIYTSNKGYVATNQENIQAVMAEIRASKPPHLFYHVCLGADGQTFTHTAFYESDEDRNWLNNLASFKKFQQQLKESNPDKAPVTEHLSLVGSSKEIFG